MALAILAPVTQEEALDFHASGRCQMMVPGQGLTRADGDGWIVSSLPGPHRIVAKKGFTNTVLLDMTPGKPYPIHVSPGTELEWCPRFAPPNRATCGPVPKAFLYDAQKVGD